MNPNATTLRGLKAILVDAGKGLSLLKEAYCRVVRNPFFKSKRLHLWASGLVACWFGAISFLFMMVSASNPIHSGTRWVDSAVFGYVSYVMEHGGMPYKDVFDHKGPLLYILNYVGDSLFGYDGVWYVELLFIFGLLCIAYRICRLKCNIPISALVASLLLIPLRQLYDGGNATEEYAMLFIAVAVYGFVKYLYFDEITKWKIFLNGACFGAVFLLRANMVAIWLVFPFFILYKDQHDLRKISHFLGLFCLGLLAVVLPICLWLIAGGAFSDFIKDYFEFNFTYVANSSSLWNRWLVIKPYRRRLFLVFSVICLFFQLGSRLYRLQTLTYLGAVIATLLTISLAGRPYSHYGMIIIPLIPFPIARFLGSSYKRLMVLQLGFCIYALFSLAGNLHSLYDNANLKFQLAEAGERTSLPTDLRKAVALIKRNTLPTDRILVIGNNPNLYTLADRLASSKYAYQYPLVIDRKLQHEFASELKGNEPKVLVVANTNRMDISEFLNLKHYMPTFKFKYGSDNAILYLKRFSKSSEPNADDTLD